jgi:hypothetical protein
MLAERSQHVRSVDATMTRPGPRASLQRVTEPMLTFSRLVPTRGTCAYDVRLDDPRISLAELRESGEDDTRKSVHMLPGLAIERERVLPQHPHDAPAVDDIPTRTATAVVEALA